MADVLLSQFAFGDAIGIIVCAICTASKHNVRMIITAGVYNAELTVRANFQKVVGLSRRLQRVQSDI